MQPLRKFILRSWAFATLLVVILSWRTAAALTLPSALHPPQPFPSIFGSDSTLEFVAPGVMYGEYRLQTAGGPLSVHVILADPKEPTLRIDTVLASDHIISRGERLSQMASRTGAIGGINADYFDIDNTNQPLGALIHSGAVLKTPNTQAALAITRDKRAVIERIAFNARAAIASADPAAESDSLPSTVALTNVNAWPPEGGASLMTPAFGPLPPAAGVIVAELQPLDDPPKAFGRYRVARISNADQMLAPQYGLAFGPAALAATHPPQPGDIITLSDNENLDRYWAAVGGGPLLVHDGRPFADPNPPAASETNVRFPVSGAIVRPDGTVVLVEVDGRSVDSVGLTRPQLAALMIALGARDGLAFDSGGSATLVARRLGERETTVQNVPSDGAERPIADGLFLYSDAPQGPPARLVVRPATIRAIAGAHIALRIAVTDNAGHPVNLPRTPRAFVSSAALGSVTAADQFVAGTRPGMGDLRVKSGTLMATVPVEVFSHAQRLMIAPQQLHLMPGQTAQLSVLAYDRSGAVITTASAVRWSATNGKISSDGHFVAGSADAVVRATVGDRSTEETIAVGEHVVDFPFGPHWRFNSAPPGGPGAIDFGSRCAGCVSLRYNFTGQERAAYLATDRYLPAFPVGLRMDVNGDGQGALLRVAVTNALDERFLLTVARVTWHGWQTREVRFPATLLPPLRLEAIYVVNALRSAPLHTAGEIGFRNLRVISAGSR
ncbi:MAG: phosphodiester glycosidase family protein [Candidatus Eremiobacteraeota bacterium]|nr:phosphodiester glycosidase family protein [Candidatus Eremiobacteraeota bacterium]